MDTGLLYDPIKVYKRKKDLMPPAYCRYTSFLRIMPDFFLGGVQKGGTTSLAYALIQHPQIIPSKNKEMFYYSIQLNFNKGPYYYRQFFATIFYKLYRKLITGKQIYSFDATTNTIDSKEAPSRIFKDNPDAKVLFLLRNPVERAFSHYKMAVKKGWEFADFEKALELEKQRLEEGIIHPLGHPDHNYAYQRLGYRERGIYINMLRNWMNVFPKQQLLILSSEEFFTHPEKTYNLICDFLKLEKANDVKFELMNEGPSGKMNQDTRDKLNAFYKPFNDELFNLIGTKYDWNK